MQQSLFDAFPAAPSLPRPTLPAPRPKPPVKDRETARAVTSAAIEQVDENADEQWKADALAAVLVVATGREFVTVDDVWEAIDASGMTVREPSALGPVMLRAQKEGAIRKTGAYRPSDRPTRHRSPLRVWKSLLFSE